MIRLAAIVIVCIAVLAPASAQSIDPRIHENPALLRLHQADPDEAERILLEIDRILISPAQPDTAPAQLKTRSAVEGSGNIPNILKTNPLMAEIYRQDPKATIKLIKAIQLTK